MVATGTGDGVTGGFHCLRGTGWVRKDWVWSQGWVRNPALI